MYHSMVKVAAAIPKVKIGDCKSNAEEIYRSIVEADGAGVEIVCFPELSITSYTCGDLLFNSSLLRASEEALKYLLEKTRKLDIISIVGMPIKSGNRLYDTAVVLQRGNILGVVPKTSISDNNGRYESRWFTSGECADNQEITLADKIVPFGANIVFTSRLFGFSVELGEDLWSVSPPSSSLATAGAHIIFNLSASNELVGRQMRRHILVSEQSRRCRCGYVFVSSGFGESSTDMLFASSAIVAEGGDIIAESQRFDFESQLVVSEIDIERISNERLRCNSFKNYRRESNEIFLRPHFEISDNKQFTISRTVNRYPFLNSTNKTDTDAFCNDIFDIQANALATRLYNANIKSAVVGVSGGLDSTLALLVTVEAFDRLQLPRKNIVGITMPGFGTTSRTKNNSIDLMAALEISTRKISITNSVLQHFEDIGHNVDTHDITYENSQARERTQILMDVANQMNAIVIGTGDMSELALGWCTYCGDQMSMYGVNSGVPKTLIRFVLDWLSGKKADSRISEIISDIIDTPISPELLPDSNDNIVQKTEEAIGPYELHDFFLYHLLRFGYGNDKISFLAQKAFSDKYTKDVIDKWLEIFMKRFLTQQFKRSCMPDGIGIFDIDLSPRSNLRLPSDIAIKRL